MSRHGAWAKRRGASKARKRSNLSCSPRVGDPCAGSRLKLSSAVASTVYIFFLLYENYAHSSEMGESRCPWRCEARY